MIANYLVMTMRLSVFPVGGRFSLEASYFLAMIVPCDLVGAEYRINERM